MRKARPLNRDIGTFRDDRLFIVATDDTYAPKQYFAQFRLRRVQIHIVPSEGGKSSAGHVLDRLLQVDHEPDDERWMLLDTDHYIQPNHIGALLRTLKDAERQGVSVALSRPCFELWLLLHHVEQNETHLLPDAKSVSEALRNVLGTYNKANVRHQDFPLTLLPVAMRRAIALDVGGEMIPSANCTRVYRLCQAIEVSMKRHRG